MSVITKIDDFILSLFQRFSDWVTRTTGLGAANYKLAYILLSSYVVLSLFAHVIAGLDFLRLFNVIIVLLVGIMYKKLFDRKERSEDELDESRVVQGFTLSNFWRIFRLFFLLYFPLLSILFLLNPPTEPLEYNHTVYHVSRYISQQSFGFALYFFACHKLPPCRGKVKEWLESFGAKPVEAKVQE